MGELDTVYKQWMHAQWLRFAHVAILIAAVLLTAFVFLDYIVYPQWAKTFFWLRLACAVIVGGLGMISITIGKAYVRIITISWLAVIQLMISTMVYLSEGADSGYYAGLNLAVVAVGILLPTVSYETILFFTGSYLLYCTACLANDTHALNNTFVGNSFFLFSTGIISSVGAYYLGERRYKEILNHRLEQRNFELAELNRQKSHFFANISHELRTPLTLILAPVQELLEGSQRLPDTLAIRLGIVRDNGLRLLKLVNDLLDVIRLEEGKEQLESVPVELNGLVGGMVDGMSHLADTKDIAFDKALAQQPLVVRGDARALEKIFVNLLSNAIKFTDTGGRISVRSSVEADWAVVQVQDTGIGIPGAELPHIFDRFRQVDGSTTRRYRGTGLGLALAKEMTERQGGRVAVESTAGIGTLMTVRLPLCAQEALAVGRPPGVESDGLERLHWMAERMGGLVVEGPQAGWEGVPEEDGRPAVLVVEDEPDMRRYLVDILEGEYRVLQARTGLEGLALAQRQRPELVLLDLMLPELDGLEVCRRIRAGEAGRQPKIMLLTARVDERAKLTALEHGADDFLTKPFSSLEVKTRLRNLLATARLEQDLVERNQRLEQTLGALQATQAQLIHSEKLNALGSLAAGLLHEINNPLNYSLTALQLIRSDPAIQGNELLREMAADIDEGMQRIRVIVTDLRAFAYPSEAQRQAPFDIREAVESALRFTAHDLKSISVRLELPQAARVLGSKSHLVQVLVNLLNNAAKAIAPIARERPGEVRIQGGSLDGWLKLRVIDNGVGMGEETLKRIFDPFFTTRDVGEGMGLGLSICHTIVANHGGRLGAASCPGEGTELILELPLAGGDTP